MFQGYQNPESELCDLGVNKAVIYPFGLIATNGGKIVVVLNIS
jgi:hypothetical protein